MVAFDPLYIITIISVSVAAIVGVLTIKNEVKKSREESANKISNAIITETSGVKQFIDDRLKIVDLKVDKNERDIRDIEVDIKQMMIDLKETCNILSKHDYVISDILPEFRILLKDFYVFKSAVDKLNDESKT